MNSVKLNDITLIHGDCLEVLSKIKAGVVDMVFADLPYGTTKCKWDVIISFDLLWKQFRRITNDNAAMLLTGTEPFSSSLRLSCLDLYRYDWYWQKDKGANFLFGNKQPLKVIETISTFYAAQPIYNPQKELNPRGTSKRHLSRNPAKISKNVKDVMGDGWKETVMDETQNYSGKDYEPDKLLPKQLVYFAREQRNKYHPTQKPVELLEYLIKTYTNENDVVLDPTMGSGTTAVACRNLNRRCIGIELNKEYFDIAVKRVNGELL